MVLKVVNLLIPKYFFILLCSNSDICMFTLSVHEKNIHV